MQNFDWSSTITVNFWVLRAVGLWPEKDKFYEANFYTFYAVFNAIVFIALHNFSQIINIFYVYTNLEALTATVFILITNMLATTKMCFFVRNMREIKQLLKTLTNEQFQPKSIDQIMLIKPSLKRWKVSYTVYTTIVSTNLVLWVLAPLMGEGYQLPFLAWYPFKIEKFPNYGIVYIYQVICIWYITAANINLDTITYALLMYIWTQCDILCDNLSTNCGNRLEYITTLVKCVKHHKKILSFARQSNNLVNMIILGQFFTSTLVLAMTMFQLSLSESLNEAAFVNIFYIIGISTQLFLYCWFGTEVEIKSSKIPFALYESQWFDHAVHVKTNMLIFSERCQRPIKITAINLFVLSLGTFVTILRSAWSYFAVLYKVNNK